MYEEATSPQDVDTARLALILARARRNTRRRIRARVGMLVLIILTAYAAVHLVVAEIAK